MFQYPPLNPLPRPNYTPRVPFCSELPPNAPTCTLRCPTVLGCPPSAPFCGKESQTVHNCPVVAYCSFLSQTVSGCRFCFCGFLWPFVASRGLLWPFEVLCGIRVALSQVVPDCPTLSHLVLRAFSVRFKGVPGAAPPQLRELVPFLETRNLRRAQRSLELWRKLEAALIKTPPD